MSNFYNHIIDKNMKLNCLINTILLALSAHVSAKAKDKDKDNTTILEVTSIYDGDTFS